MRISKSTIKRILAGIVLGVLLFVVYFLVQLSKQIPVLYPQKGVYTSYYKWAGQFVPQQGELRSETKQLIQQVLNDFSFEKEKVHWYQISFRPIGVENFALDNALRTISKEEDMHVYSKGDLIFIISNINYFSKPLWHVNVRTKNVEDVQELARYINMEQSVKQNKDGDLCYMIDGKCVILANDIYMFYSYFHKDAQQYQVYFSLADNISTVLKGTFYTDTNVGDIYTMYTNKGGLGYWRYTFWKTAGYNCDMDCDYGYIPDISEYRNQDLVVKDYKVQYMFLPVISLMQQDLIGGYLVPFYYVHLQGHQVINQEDYTLNLFLMIPAVNLVVKK